MADTTHGTFCWHEIGTRDAARAKAFYAEVLGYGVDDEPSPGGGIYTHFKLAGGDEVAGLYQMEGEMFEGVPPHWLPYVWVDDVTATAEKATSIGGEVRMGPMSLPGVGDLAILKDPAGAVVGIFHGSEHQGAIDAHGQGAFAWDELMTPDKQAAATFYRALFGWRAQEVPMDASTGYTLFKRGDADAAGMMETTGSMAGVPPNWTAYIHVDDSDASVAKAAELGATIRVPATDIPNVGRFAIIEDPTGAVFGILQPPTGG
jgi:hypothetical protein